jgi:hypothetical protein
MFLRAVVFLTNRIGFFAYSRSLGNEDQKVNICAGSHCHSRKSLRDDFGKATEPLEIG